MPDTSTRAQLSASLAADPSNSQLRLIYADYLGELRDAAAARQHRTMARMPRALVSTAGRAAHLMQGNVWPGMLKLTLAAVLTLLGPTE